MQQSLSSRTRSLNAPRRGRFTPRVDLLEDRLAPGDAILSQVLGLSLIGPDLDFLGNSAYRTGSEAQATTAAEVRWLTADESAVVEAASFVAAAAVDVAHHAVGGTAQSTEERVALGSAFDTNAVLASALPADPLGEALFSAVAAVARHGQQLVAETAPAGVDGSGFGSVGIVSSVGTGGEAPTALVAASNELTAALQWNADGSALTSQHSQDQLLRTFGNGYLPEGWTPPAATSNDVTPPVLPGGRPGLAPPRPLTNPNGDPSTQGPPDPGLPGPLPVTRIEYDLGNITLPGTPGPVEVQASVHYPTGLPGGPYPFVLYMHGRHATCYNTQTNAVALEWPCAGGRVTIPSFRGYDYMSNPLASHGYIVVSVSANGINARDNSVQDLGMLWRAQLIQHHLDLWNTWSTVGGGPAGIGNAFIGQVDLQNIGTMGHSRGGEGVARHWVYNESLGRPYNITAVLPLAPVDFNRPRIQFANQLTILPPCDGDVSDLQGAHFFDDARNNNATGDFGYKHLITFSGANHNHFNTIWTPGEFPAGTLNDSRCNSSPGRLTAPQQRDVARAYMNAFFRFYLSGYQDFYWDVLTGYAPVPPSAGSARVFTAYQAPLQLGWMWPVNPLLTAADLSTNILSGGVSQSGLTPYELCGGAAPQVQHCTSLSTALQPHTVPSARATTMRGLSQMRFGWNNTSATWRNEIPEGLSDVSYLYSLNFRAAVNPTDARNPSGQAQDFTVVLTDGDGNESSALVSDHSTALYYPTGLTSALPIAHLLLHTVSIPLTAFSSADLTDIRSIEFRFDQRSTGALLVSDLHFSN